MISWLRSEGESLYYLWKLDPEIFKVEPRPMSPRFAVPRRGQWRQPVLKAGNLPYLWVNCPTLNKCRMCCWCVCVCIIVETSAQQVHDICFDCFSKGEQWKVSIFFRRALPIHPGNVHDNGLKFTPPRCVAEERAQVSAGYCRSSNGFLEWMRVWFYWPNG